MSCDSFGNLILRSNVVPNAQLVTFDRLGLNSVLFLANFLTYTKVRFIANFFQWNTLENLLFPFQVPWKKASKDWWTKSNCIPNDRMYAYRLCNMQYISVSLMHLSVIIDNPFWVYYIIPYPHCLKITQNVAFQFLNFGIFHQFLYF